MARLITSGLVVPRDLEGYNARTELRRLDAFAASSKVGGGPWKTDSIKIKMPCTRALKPTFSTEKDAPTFEVHGVRYRSLVDLLVAKVQDPSFSKSFRYTPFTEWWCPPGSTKPIRIYGEAYSSDVAVQLYEEIKGIPPPPGHPQIESVVVMLMLESDATHLADFGTASLWPIYVLFGNMSKYDRSQTSEFAACHLAYLPKVSHSPPLLVLANHPATSSQMTLQIHTRRSSVSHPLMTSSPIAGGSCITLWWSAFSRASLRRFIRRGLLFCSLMESTAVSFHGSTATQQTTQRSIASPSTNYIPQQLLTTVTRVLIANIKNLGKCPCPRCLVQLGEVRDLGKAVDKQRRDDIRRPTHKLFRIIKKARKAIFKGFKVSGTRVERLLEGGSRVAVNVGHPCQHSCLCTTDRNALQNAFMACFSDLNVYSLLVVDLLHEVELGVWKALFTHIVRMLQFHSPSAIAIFDER